MAQLTQIVHYSRGEPFLSISFLSEDRRREAVAKLNESNAWGLGRFADPLYMGQRISVERRLRADFIARGGRPELESPIYFFLGRNLKFEEHPLNVGYAIDLVDVAHDQVSFTYGDSLLAFEDVNRLRMGAPYENPLCARLFLKRELSELFGDPNFPETSPLHVEAQLWFVPSERIVQKVVR